MFLWGAVSHMVLPTGEIGVKMLSDEPAVLAVLAEKVKDPGVYLFPGADSGEDWKSTRRLSQKILEDCWRSLRRMESPTTSVTTWAYSLP